MEVSDIRESPSFKIMELIEKWGGACHYIDPHVPVIPPTREHPDFVGRKSVDMTAETLTAYHAVLIDGAERK